MKKYKLGVFMTSGGNRVAFIDGVLDVFKENNISINYYVGVSASSIVMISHIINKNKEFFKIFKKKLRKNKKNIYFFSKNSLPHNDIYKGSIKEFLGKYYFILKDSKADYRIILSKTKKNYCKLKAINLTFLSFLKFVFNLNLFGLYKKIAVVSKMEINPRKLSNENLINSIMGSSTVYPFIKLHYDKGYLLLDGAVFESEYAKSLKNCKKGIIIFPYKGKTRVKNNILYLYSTKHVSLNLIDYTNASKITDLQRLGKKEAKKQMSVITKYLKS